MAEQSTAQKKTVERVMHEFKHGELSGRDGTKVKNPKQAIAIALHEAGASNQEDAKTNRRNLARTKVKERSGDTSQARTEGEAATAGGTRAELYKRAKSKKIPGRSKMSKAELAKALRR